MAAMSAQALSRALPPGAVLVVMAVVALNLADAFLTLWHVGLGAVELNPLMDRLLAHGPAAFVAGKHFAVSASIVAMAATCVHRPAFDRVAFFALALYASITAYQLALIGVAP